MKRPFIANQDTEILVGLVLAAAGVALLWDAWEGRGARTPWFLRPFLPV